jgi:hypothetical protein
MNFKPFEILGTPEPDSNWNELDLSTQGLIQSNRLQENLPPVKTEIDLSKRNFLRTGAGIAVGSLVFGGAFTAPSCPGAKNLSTYVNVVIGALQELSPLLPGQAQLIAKAVSIAKTFDDAYRAGKFIDAGALFENLAGVIGQIAESVGVASPSVKVAIAVAGIAMRAIAVLLKSQTSDPTIAAIASDKARSNPNIARQQALIEKLANEKEIDILFKGAKP